MVPLLDKVKIAILLPKKNQKESVRKIEFITRQAVTALML